MKTKNCDECIFSVWVEIKNKSLNCCEHKCLKGYRPKFYLPKTAGDVNYGYKRKCSSFKKKINKVKEDVGLYVIYKV